MNKQINKQINNIYIYTHTYVHTYFHIFSMYGIYTLETARPNWLLRLMAGFGPEGGHCKFKVTKVPRLVFAT